MGEEGGWGGLRRLNTIHASLQDSPLQQPTALPAVHMQRTACASHAHTHTRNMQHAHALQAHILRHAVPELVAWRSIFDASILDAIFSLSIYISFSASFFCTACLALLCVCVKCTDIEIPALSLFSMPF